MATFKICVFEHQKREDGMYPISIRLTNNRKSVYINTGNYVTRSQISKDFKSIRDIEVTRSIDKQINKYQDIIRDNLGPEVTSYSVQELYNYLTKQSTEKNLIDFVKFSRGYIEDMMVAGRTEYGKLMSTTINSLVDFFQREEIFIKEITSKNLQKYAEYLKTERRMIRPDRLGKDLVIKRAPVCDRTLSDYMTNIRTLFNAAVDHYNDEEMGITVITHYPFRKYKIERNFESAKRNLSIDDLKAIRDLPDMNNRQLTRMPLGRDIFMLSFYLLGTNVADLYDLDSYKDGRISYNRRKTKSRRSDKAYISIKVQPEAIPLIEKYRDKTDKRVFKFHSLYADHKSFLKHVNAGLKQVAKKTGITDDLSSYYARHSWATLARNKCDIRLEDINLSLNHVDLNMKMTDIYIDKDWSQIDNANRKVLDLLK